MTAKRACIKLRSFASQRKARVLRRFFKTGKGEYGEGDIFIGVTVPEIRSVSIEFINLPSSELKKLVCSKIHEERLLGLLIFVEQFKRADPNQKERICKLYFNLKRHINNWDLIDLTADKIVGPYLRDKNRSVLYELSKSKVIWDRRIAIIATFHFIKNRDFKDTFTLAEIYLEDKHDLMHKATGWMLREIGKRDLPALKRFLKNHYKSMPRTMLRYAIEKFPEKERKRYLKGFV